MNANPADYFVSYNEWHDAITIRCGIQLTPEYCAERVLALQDSKDVSTSQFLELYGVGYRDKVIAWFKRAGAAS